MQCLVETGADMDEEWTICMAIAEGSGKNYQLWNHRRLLAMQMGRENAMRELEFASSFLDVDEKNYHIWSHRQVSSLHHAHTSFLFPSVQSVGTSRSRL